MRIDYAGRVIVSSIDPVGLAQTLASQNLPAEQECERCSRVVSHEAMAALLQVASEQAVDRLIEYTVGGTVTHDELPGVEEFWCGECCRDHGVVR